MCTSLTLLDYHDSIELQYPIAKEFQAYKAPVLWTSFLQFLVKAMSITGNSVIQRQSQINSQAGTYYVKFSIKNADTGGVKEGTELQPYFDVLYASLFGSAPDFNFTVPSNNSLSNSIRTSERRLLASPYILQTLRMQMNHSRYQKRSITAQYSHTLPFQDLSIPLSPERFNLALRKAPILFYSTAQSSGRTAFGFTVVSLIYTGLVMVLLFLYRSTPGIKGIDPRFCAVMLIGFALAQVLVFFYLDIPDSTACVMRSVCLPIAFGLVFG
jgi:hypothetical protein